jgi:S1-C subfamily serine protease
LLRITAKPPAPLEPVSFRKGTVTLGEQVFAMGYPISHMLGKNIHVTQGLISATSGLQGNTDQIQVSAGIQPGNSGGPVLDANGRVAGIVQQTINPWAVAQQTGGALPQNVNFGIKADVALAFLKERQSAVHGRLLYDRTATLADVQRSVVRIRSGLVPKELEGARKVVAFLHYESFFDGWYRFRYFVLSFYDFDTQQLLFRAGQVRDDILSNRTVVIDDTFKAIERTMGRAVKPPPP